MADAAGWAFHLGTAALARTIASVVVVWDLDFVVVGDGVPKFGRLLFG
ncbi:hypothetical protein [Mycobacterium leprae]